MRVIAGSAKGRVLKSVEGKNTRPTTDKVKEAIFNIINPYLNEGIVLDLFAGTGGLGIEALSRGMEKAIFVDYSQTSINTIKKNIEATNFQNNAEIYKNDAERALKALIKRNISFDIIFLDPPYKLQIIPKLINLFAKNNLVKPNGIVVVEHDVDYQFPEQIDHFYIIKKAVYGNIGITIFKSAN